MKIGVVGCGQVGSASAYACVMRGIGTEIVLVDAKHDLAVAQAEDISHATPFGAPIPVTAASYEDLSGAGLIMVASGVSQKPGETRLDLLKRNADVFAEVIPKIRRAAPEAIILNATNPVDIMTHLAFHFGECEQAKIIGSGTILDTARFRTLLASHVGVSPHSVHAHVLGEHGDSEVLHWSGSFIGNIPAKNFAAQMSAPITDQIKEEIDLSVRGAAQRIIKGKGATWYGVGAGMARIAQAIINNESTVLTCCTPVAEVEGITDITLSLPQIVSAKGIKKTLYPELNSSEKEYLKKSAEIVRTAIFDTLGK